MPEDPDDDDSDDDDTDNGGDSDSGDEPSRPENSDNGGEDPSSPSDDGSVGMTEEETDDGGDTDDGSDTDDGGDTDDGSDTDDGGDMDDGGDSDADEEPEDDGEKVFDTPDMIHPEGNVTDNDEDRQAIPPIIPIGAGGVGAGTGAWYFFWWRKRRKIRGCVIDGEGNPVEGIRLTLSGKQELEVITDKDGEYAFKRVKDDVIEMNAFDAEGAKMFTVEIATKEKDVEEIFAVIEKNVSDLQFDRAGKTLFVDVTV